MMKKSNLDDFVISTPSCSFIILKGEEIFETGRDKGSFYLLYN